MVVTGRRDGVRTSIDAISYSLANDLQTSTGTLADALRNVPSVQVDPNGEVSLRGDPGVTILVDGRPAAQFNGPARGQLILQSSAGQYARIEVMTNPSAVYSPEGAGGVINLITKPAVPAAEETTTGSIRVNIGDNGRYNLGANVVTVRGKLTLSADAGTRHEGISQEGLRLRRRFDPVSDRFLDARQTQQFEGASDSVYIQLAAEYRLDDQTLFNSQLRHNDARSSVDILDLYEAENASGGVASAFRRQSDSGFEGHFSGATARLVRQFDAEGHEWSNEVRYDRASNLMRDDAVTGSRIPVAPDSYESVANRNRNTRIGFTSAYTRPFESGARLRAGYELETADYLLDNRVLRGPSREGLVLDPLVSNEFQVDQAVHAVYATYDRPFGDALSAQFGLRLEQAFLDLDQRTTDVQSSNDYFRAYPTGHLAYQLSDQDTVRASYGRRIQRPNPTQLNPFLTYFDSLNYGSGNPDLLPQETDAYELTWERRSQQDFYKATLFFRDTTDAFTSVTSDLGGGVFVSRNENLGSRQATGIEIVANGALFPSLRYNASVTLSYQAIDASNIPGAVDREGESVSGGLGLNWKPTDIDFVQLSGVWTGEQLLAQGTREPSTLINFGYRRTLSDRWALQATVRDVFDDYKDVSNIETATFINRNSRTSGGRTFLVGLTWAFGHSSEPVPFDYAPGS